MSDVGGNLKGHAVVSHEEWLAARTALLAKEKEFTRLRDELSQQRRALPWEKVDKEYIFEGSRGRQTLAELFEGRSQLVMYQFMFSPEWDEGCLHCSFWADSFNGTAVHLRQRDVTFLAVSRAPMAKIEAFKKRMGWDFTWVSSFGSDFNYDYQASFRPEEVQAGRAFYNYTVMDPYDADREGISVFCRHDSGAVYHTYSCYARGIDMVNAAYQILDLTPKGRDEEGLPGPQDWVRHHDRYED
jgi:predicted dithiol-disulfide oxidoreductase (DUF899 family)